MTIRGYGKQITLQKAKNFKERQIEVIDSKINEFYYDTNAALLKYIHETNSNIESRRLFGKDENSDESIGRYVQQLVDDGELNPVAQNEVIEILRSRFNFQYSGGPVSLFKNIGYITSMGSPTSAITQIGDMAWAMYAAGPKHTLKALGQVIAHKDQITREDIGIERIGEEFADMKTLAKTIDKVFTITGLKSIDRLGNETLINA